MSGADSDQAIQTAIEHHRAGRLAEAEAIYRRILERRPDDPEALHMLGALAHQVGKRKLAIELIGRAIAVDPHQARYYNNLGLALMALEHAPEAASAFAAAARLTPGLAEVHNNLGNALAASRRYSEAVQAFGRAIELNPRWAQAHHNLGNALGKLGEIDRTLAAFRAAIAIDPGLHESYHNLGVALMQAGRLDEAAEALETVIRLKPDLAEAYVFLGNVRKDQGNIAAAIDCYREGIRIRPDLVVAESNLVWASHFYPDYDSRVIAALHARWNQHHAEPLGRMIRPHVNDRSADRRLRIGYLSPNFYDHVIGRNVLPLLANHDHQQFEIYCYFNFDRADALTARFRSHADHWLDVLPLTDEQLVERIHNDRIDILVDLALHLEGNRLLVFARKPAPVQVTFAGYPASTGLTAIDYRLTDPYLDPPGGDESVYSERCIRLSETFWCYEPFIDEPPSPPMLANGHITFGCLNHISKTNPAVFALWSRVLKAIPDSQLVLQAYPGTHRSRAIDALAIEPARVRFVDRCPRDAFMKLHHQIDIVLDTFPYNGHSTSLEAMWMGVPVVSLCGETVVSRAGLSQATNLGLAGLVARSPDQFVKIATDLAGDRARLSELRATLRSRMTRSPLMDAPRFARHVEQAYRSMWQQWLNP